jgi:hypothetical protein
MPPFVFADFLATLPALPTTLAFIAVAATYAFRVMARREQAHAEFAQRERMRSAALERARLEAIARISANHHDKGAA